MSVSIWNNAKLWAIKGVFINTKKMQFVRRSTMKCFLSSGPTPNCISYEAHLENLQPCVFCCARRYSRNINIYFVVFIQGM